MVTITLIEILKYIFLFFSRMKKKIALTPPFLILIIKAKTKINNINTRCLRTIKAQFVTVLFRCSIGDNLPEQFSHLFLFYFIFLGVGVGVGGMFAISLLFHLFFLILTCSCPYSYNLMLTVPYMCRPYICSS
jgi:hypothetical protein